MNTKFQNALKLEPQNTPPVWMMRQAGRYHRHYQALRAKYSFMQLCLEPELAAQVALGPVEDFKFDVAILFSDILFPLDALGFGLSFGDGGPQFERSLTPEMLSKLPATKEILQKLHFQKEALKATREILPKTTSLIGFVGGIFTLFSYAVGGKHDGHLIPAKQQLPVLFEKFCEHLVPLIIENIELQLRGGAECVMIFDTAAGELSPDLYSQYILPQLKKIFLRFPKKLGYYSKGTQPRYLQDPIFYDGTLLGLGFDHRWDLANDCLSVSQRGFVQGNFDQSLLHAAPDDFKKLFKNYLKKFQNLSPTQRRGWVCGLGHGVLPKTPEENVRAFVQIVQESFA